MAHPPPQPRTTTTIAIAIALAGSTAAAWAALHLTPGIHLDGPPAHQAQAIAITALLLLATTLAGRITLHRTHPHTPAPLRPATLAIPLLLTPATLWLSALLCTTLGLPLRIDGPTAILTGWLIIGAVRLLMGAALKLLTPALRPHT